MTSLATRPRMKLTRQATLKQQLAKESDKAFRAVRELERMCSQTLTPVARSIARNPRLKVQVGPQSCTDGTDIYLRPPMQLGEVVRHDRSLCGERDNDTSKKLCPACAQRDDVLGIIYHELAHICFNSFEAIPDRDKAQIVERALKLHPHKSGSRVEKLIAEFEKNKQLSFVAACSAVSPYLHSIFNAMEDARVNTQMFRAREGTYHMFRARTISAFEDGIEMPDGSRQFWADRTPEEQATIGLLCKLSGFQYSTWLHPEIINILETPELDTILGGMTDANSAGVTYERGFKALEYFRSMGLFVDPDDMEDDPSDEPQDNSAGQSGEEQDDSSGSGASNNDEQSGDSNDEQQQSGSMADDGDAGQSDDMEQSDDGDADGDSSMDDDDVSDAESDGGSGDGESDDDTTESTGKGADDEDSDQKESDSGSGDLGDESDQNAQDADDNADGTGDDDGDDADADDGSGDGVDGGNLDKSMPHGTPEEVERALSQLGDHDETQATDVNNRETQVIKTAIQQAEHFDTPSASISGVEVHRADKPATASFRWFDESRAGDIRQYKPEEALVNRLIFQMRRIFAENRHAKVERGHRGGRPDSTRLHTVASGNKKVFTRTERPGKRDYFVGIALDCSGSTGGPTNELIKEMGMALGDLLDRVGVPFVMYGHTSHRNYSGMESLDILNVRTHGERWTDKERRALTCLQGHEYNIDGHMLEWMRKRADESTASDKLILYVTDGEMPNHNYSDEVEVLERELETCKQRRINLLGVGIETDSPKRHGLNTVCLNSTSDLHLLMEELERIFVRNN